MKSRLTQKEQGVIKVVLDRFNNDRLPALIKMKDRVNNGEQLSELDIRVLEDSIEEAKSGDRFSEKHPEFKNLVAQVSALYKEITTKALENQQK